MRGKNMLTTNAKLLYIIMCVLINRRLPSIETSHNLCPELQQIFWGKQLMKY